MLTRCYYYGMSPLLAPCPTRRRCTISPSPPPPGHVQVLSMLVKEGQDTEVEDVYGQTPLHLASLRGNVDVAEYLVVEVRQQFAF